MRLKLIKGFTPSKFAPVRIARRFIASIKKTGSSHGNDALRTPAGFTLNELLIVIAILAILAGATVLVLNPGELLGQARDSKRIGELNSLASAITFHTNSIVGGYKGEEDTVYISLPDTVETCDTLLPSLPAIPAGWSYHCVTAENLQKTDGDGWLPINLNATPGGSPFEQLPIDPENSAANNLYFAYVKSDTGYTLASLLESEKQGVEARKDGGSDFSRFEVGSDFTLWRTASGLAGYWPLNGSGNISNGQTDGLQDESGKGNNGSASNVNGSGMLFSEGKIDTSVEFDGIDDYVSGPFTAFGIGKPFSISAWARATTSFGYSPGIVSLGYSPVIVMQSDGKVRAWWYNGSSWPGILSLRSYNDGNFHFYALTYDGTTAKLYVDGSLEASMASNINAIYSGIEIGREKNSGSKLFKGQIDNYQIYNRALTSAEVRAMYNSGK